MPLAYFADLFSHLNDLKTSIQGTAMNMIRARESIQYMPSLINFQSESGYYTNFLQLDEGSKEKISLLIVTEM